MKQRSKIFERNSGNSCSNPFYQNYLELTKVCPKWGGKIETDYQNDYKTKIWWDDNGQCYLEFKDYNERKICTGVGFNYNIGKEDVNI